MFTVRSHPPKGPSSAPFSSPGGAVVAFGGRFPALLLLLGLVFVFLPVYFCVRFSWVFALPAYRPWSFIFLPSLGSAFSGGRLRRLILLRFRSLLPGGSFFLRSCLSSRVSVSRPGSLCFRLGPSFCSSSFSGSSLCFFWRPFPLGTSFSLGTSFILISSPVLFSASCDIFSCLSLLNFLSLYFLIFFYLFLFISICPPKGLRKGRVGVGTLSSGGCGKWVHPWGKHYFNPSLPYEGLKEY